MVHVGLHVRNDLVHLVRLVRDEDQTEGRGGMGDEEHRVEEEGGEDQLPNGAVVGGDEDRGPSEAEGGDGGRLPAADGAVEHHRPLKNPESVSWFRESLPFHRRGPLPYRSRAHLCSHGGRVCLVHGDRDPKVQLPNDPKGLGRTTGC